MTKKTPYIPRIPQDTDETYARAVELYSRHLCQRGPMNIPLARKRVHEAEPRLTAKQAHDLAANVAQGCMTEQGESRDFYIGVALEAIAHRIHHHGWPDLDDRRRMRIAHILIDTLFGVR